jgi:hypothetical protein
MVNVAVGADALSVTPLADDAPLGKVMSIGLDAEGRGAGADATPPDEHAIGRTARSAVPKHRKIPGRKTQPPWRVVRPRYQRIVAVPSRIRARSDGI